MSNKYFTHPNRLTPYSTARAEEVNDIFDAIASGFEQADLDIAAAEAAADADRVAAEVARTGAETAQGASETARDASQAAQLAAEAARDAAQASQSAAGASATAALTSEQNAEYWADQASSVVAGGAIDDTITAADRTWSSQKIDAEKADQYSVTTTAVSKTLADKEFCVVTAATQTLTLPASPTGGMEVAVTTLAFTDTVVDRNGELVMGIAENLTIDKEQVTVTLRFTDAANGWRIV